jgi:hypothetical protein
MQSVAPVAETARTETPAQPAPQSAPLPLDLDVLQHVAGGGPGGSWGEFGG